ncbi:MAG: helix-turn-helix domain-containing protein [Lachnospiraceae bacterium]|nr:helix-turn-helix domain-containing protein [Lachnospiraceae bacterium]
MRKGNRRLNYEDRKKIEKLTEQGTRVIVIADTIGVHRATIYNELKRGGTPYRAEVAQRTV